MRLSGLMASAGRNNNFNLIRILAALSVLVSHSFALATGDPGTEPFAQSLGLSLGRMAVDIFFVTSGFLICGSLVSRGDVIQFICSRVMRIYPGLIVVLIITAFLLGPVLTDLSLRDYFSKAAPWTYVLQTGIIIAGPQAGLPGVFVSNPYPLAVNGSLWTLRFEILMYGLVFAVWMVCTAASLGSKGLRRSVLLLAIIALTAYWWTRSVSSGLPKIWLDIIKLFAMFFMGASVRLYSEKIDFNGKWATLMFGLLLLASTNGPIFLLAWPVAITYLVFYVAYAGRGIADLYNRVGDYSYGMYIYAFPVQQTLAAVFPGISVSAMIAWSMVITMPLAIASWYLIESRALDSIPAVVSAIKYFISNRLSGVRRPL